MTTETTPPQENPSSSPSPQANPNGPRQKQSFRRRRKRRGAASSANPAGGANAAANGAQSAGEAGAGQGPAVRAENQPGRHKKKFFKKNANPGQNQPAGRKNGGQQRRAGKQRKPKTFVGPMDHSYRAVNGNYAEAPPSTFDLQRGYSGGQYNGNGNANGNSNGNFNGHGGGLPVESVQAAAKDPAQANAPARIYCFIDDLFFMAKIQEAARKLGVKVAFIKNDKTAVAEMLALPEAERPTLIVFDLNNANAKPLTLIPKFKSKLKRATSIVGFLSHLQGELKAKAIEAGCDTVMPRSAFSQSLPNLLRRYGLEEQPEFAEV